MMAGRAIELREVDRLCLRRQISRLFPLLGLPRQPACKVKNALWPRFIDEAVPMRRLALEIRVKLEGEARMASRDQVVIDDVRLPKFVAWSHVAFHAGGGSLVQAFFGVDEAGGVAVKSGAVMRLQPLAGRAMT